MFHFRRFHGNLSRAAPRSDAVVVNAADFEIHTTACDVASTSVP